MTTPISPFQIRLELLRMAKDLLMNDHQDKKNIIDATWNSQVEAAKINGVSSPEHPGYPQIPNEEDIVKKAEALNQFVSQTPPQPEVKITKKHNS